MCRVCDVPFTRLARGGARSSNFYRTAAENDTCIVCREGLNPADWLPQGRVDRLGTQRL